MRYSSIFSSYPRHTTSGRTRRSETLVLVFLCFIFLGTAANAANKPPKIEPSEGRLLATKKPPAKNYSSCRKELITKLKKGIINKYKFSSELNACRENYPASVVYTACKRQFLKQSKNQKPSRSALEACKEQVKSLEFSPDNPTPFLVEQGQLYFAGIGINRSQASGQLNPPNFSCVRLQNATKSTAHAQYVLFGNHPSTFRGFKNKTGEEVLDALGNGLRPSSAETKKKGRQQGSGDFGLEYIGFGRIYERPTSSKALAFFPVAACDFSSEMGPNFLALSTYYLIDSVASSVTPFFGIVYFDENQTQFTTTSILQELLKRLGEEFNTIKKNKITSFVAAANPREFDNEGDPKNLCKEPRDHKFFGIVQGQKSNPEKPDFVLLASVKNLCDFGDRLSLRLIK